MKLSWFGTPWQTKGHYPTRRIIIQRMSEQTVMMRCGVWGISAGMLAPKTEKMITEFGN